MNYETKNIGMLLKRELGFELQVGYEPCRLANWAYYLMIDMRDDPNIDVFNILDRIALMEVGEEFQYTPEELNYIADRMILGDGHPFKKWDSLRESKK